MDRLGHFGNEFPSGLSANQSPAAVQTEEEWLITGENAARLLGLARVEARPDATQPPFAVAE